MKKMRYFHIILVILAGFLSISDAQALLKAASSNLSAIIGNGSGGTLVNTLGTYSLLDQEPSYFSITTTCTGSAACQTTDLQKQLIAAREAAFTLKAANNDDQMQRNCIEFIVPRGQIGETSPIIVPALVCWNADGYFRRIGTAGSATTAFDGSFGANANKNLEQPAVIFPPLAHNLGHLDVYANSNGSDNGSGAVFGKNWVPATAVLQAGGTAYTAGDTLTLPQPDNSPYIAPQVIVDTVNGSGVIQTSHLSVTVPGGYSLPSALQQYEYTAANGWTGAIATPTKGSRGKVFDTAHTGWYVTSGGTGTGAEFTLTYTPDFAGAGADYSGGAYLQASTIEGNISVQGAGNVSDATYGSTFAVGIVGANHFGGNVTTTGGHYGIWCPGCTDFFWSNLNPVNADIGLKFGPGGGSLRGFVTIDSPVQNYITADHVDNVVLTGDFLQANSGITGAEAIILGNDATSNSTNLNAALNFDFSLYNSGGASPIPAMLVKNTIGSTFKLSINNIAKSGSAEPTQISSYAVLGANGVKNTYNGSIASLTAEGNLFSGLTEPQSNARVWDAAKGGFIGLDNSLAANTANVQVPVCNQVFDTDGGQNSAGQQTSGRMVFYCPNGATSLSLVFANFWMNGTTETSLVDPIPLNLSVVNIPSPWNAATSYTTGQTATYNATQSATGTYANNSVYTAAGNNTNSAPIPTNTNWSAGAVPTPIAITCFGGRNCTSPTQVTPAGTLVTQPILTTDPVNITVPIGGYIAVYEWSNQTGTQKLVTNSFQQYTLGNKWTQSGSTGDLTLSAVNTNKVSQTSLVGPQAIIGYPLINLPTVAIIGHSQALGIDGSGLSALTVAAGGNSFTSADEGVVCKLPDTGASSFEVGRSAQFIITTVAAGAVTQIQIYDSGAYAGTNNGQSLPTQTAGAQIVSGCGHGSSLTLTATFNSSGHDFGNAFGAQGFLKRAIAESGLVYTGVVHAGDTVADWTARDYNRLPFITATHARNAVILEGANELGTTPATTEASLTALAAALKGNGYIKAVFLATILPQATSTDGYAGTANQTVSVNEANRITLNTWMRTVPAGFDGVLETAWPVESAHDSGKWVVGSDACNGGNTAQRNVATCDDIHVTTYGIGLIDTSLGNLSNVFQ